MLHLLCDVKVPKNTSPERIQIKFDMMVSQFGWETLSTIIIQVPASSNVPHSILSSWQEEIRLIHATVQTQHTNTAKDALYG